MVGTHLDDREAMSGFEAQQRQRHADVVVEVTARRECRAGAREYRREHLLGGRLAVAAAHAEHEGAAPRAPVRRDRSERRERVPDHDLRQRRIDRAAHDGACRATPGSTRDELVAVEALATQRDEEHAALDAARVGRDAGEFRIPALEASPGHGGGFRQPALHCGSPERARRRSRSLNGRRSRPTIW